MGVALKIREGLAAEELRRAARREQDGRAAARMYAIANALEGQAGRRRRGLPEWSGKRCVTRCCVTMPKALLGCMTDRMGARRSADLTHAAGMWMTPTARDHKDGATTLVNTPVNGLLGRQVLVTPMAGSNTSDARRTLNPLFVEALMGWPTGWTGFGSVATAWSRWLRRMRCELSQLNCWPIDEDAA